MGNKSAFQGTPYGKTTPPFKEKIMNEKIEKLLDDFARANIRAAQNFMFGG